MLTNEAGFLDVDPKTLQHNKFKNIFGIGDCSSSPNSKTMAAIGILINFSNETFVNINFINCI